MSSVFQRSPPAAKIVAAAGGGGGRVEIMSGGGENAAPLSAAQAHSAGVWKLRKAMFLWDLGHYGYELLYWCATFTAFFLSALWEESFKLRNGESSSESGLEDASRRLLAVAEAGFVSVFQRRRRLAAEGGGAGYEEYDTAAEGAEAGVASAETDEFSPGEISTYATFFVAAVLTLVIKYLVFPWFFMSVLPRLRNTTADSFALGMFCTFKAFGKLVKISTEFAIPYWVQSAAGEDLSAAASGAANQTSAISSIGEYFGDFIFAPWLFVVYVMPILKTLLLQSVAKKEAEP